MAITLDCLHTPVAGNMRCCQGRRQGTQHVCKAGSCTPLWLKFARPRMASCSQSSGGQGLVRTCGCGRGRVVLVRASLERPQAAPSLVRPLLRREGPPQLEKPASKSQTTRDKPEPPSTPTDTAKQQKEETEVPNSVTQKEGSAATSTSAQSGNPSSDPGVPEVANSSHGTSTRELATADISSASEDNGRNAGSQSLDNRERSSDISLENRPTEKHLDTSRGDNAGHKSIARPQSSLSASIARPNNQIPQASPTSQPVARESNTPSSSGSFDAAERGNAVSTSANTPSSFKALNTQRPVLQKPNIMPPRNPELRQGPRKEVPGRGGQGTATRGQGGLQQRDNRGGHQRSAPATTPGQSSGRTDLLPPRPSGRSDNSSRSTPEERSSRPQMNSRFSSQSVGVSTSTTQGSRGNGGGAGVSSAVQNNRPRGDPSSTQRSFNMDSSTRPGTSAQAITGTPSRLQRPSPPNSFTVSRDKPLLAKPQLPTAEQKTSVRTTIRPQEKRDVQDNRYTRPYTPPPRTINGSSTNDAKQLSKPMAPSVRSLEALYDKDSQKGTIDKKPRIIVIEETDGEAVKDQDETEEKKKGGKGRKKRKEKVTAEMKRKAREQRDAAREVKAAQSRREREEIFEVGEEGMSLEELASNIQVHPSDIVRSLFMKGIMLSMNQVLDKNTVKLVAQEYEILVVDKAQTDVSEKAKKHSEFLLDEDVDQMVSRPPVVTVMGHVDHGKTSLLDFVRKSRVAAGEAGGITQAIGAYNVELDLEDEKKTICFLDTPGHEAFSSMRARGARVTDIAIIVVAADDGVQPQTKEAIMHAQAAEVPIVVAINKIDKVGADPERTKQSLTEAGIVPEEWGGKIPVVAISAKKGTGVDSLLQMVLWVAEEQQLMANPNRVAAGTVIEAHLDKKKGPMATLLVQSGTLHDGDIVAAGACFGKVRSLVDSAGRVLHSAGPSIAVQMMGLGSTPQAGDEFLVYRTEAEARTHCSKFGEQLRSQRLLEMTGGGSMVTLSSLASVEDDQEVMQKLNLIIKGDTSGVVEAIKASLSSLPQTSVSLRFLLAGTGDISSSDIELAAASGGMVLGFNVHPDDNVIATAKRLGVTISTYNIIYNLIDDVRAAMEGKLRAIEERISVGKAIVKQVFGEKARRVAGCAVTEGRLKKNCVLVVQRAKTNQVVFDGLLASLRRVKDIVEEVPTGQECGVGAENWADWREGDLIECFQLVPKVRRLEDSYASTAVDVASIN